LLIYFKVSPTEHVACTNQSSQLCVIVIYDLRIRTSKNSVKTVVVFG